MGGVGERAWVEGGVDGCSVGKGVDDEVVWKGISPPRGKGAATS